MKNKKLGYFIGSLSLLLNIILFLVKYYLGAKINSISIKADAWHTLSDSLTSLIVIFGLWISSKKPDKDHPFGHGRAESIATIIIGTLLAVVGFNFIKEAVSSLIIHKSAIFDKFTVLIIFSTVLIKEMMAILSIHIGKKLSLKSLIADGWHHRSDAISSAVIVIGALFSKYLWWVDGIMGIAVSLLILYATYEIFKESANALLGEKPDQKLEENIISLIKEITPEVKELHHFHVHRYGDHIELTFHIRLPKDIRLDLAHDITLLIEKEIRETYKIETTIHAEPL